MKVSIFHFFFQLTVYVSTYYTILGQGSYWAARSLYVVVIEEEGETNIPLDRKRNLRSTIPDPNCCILGSTLLQEYVFFCN